MGGRAAPGWIATRVIRHIHLGDMLPCVDRGAHAGVSLRPGTGLSVQVALPDRYRAIGIAVSAGRRTGSVPSAS